MSDTYSLLAYADDDTDEVSQATQQQEDGQEQSKGQGDPASVTQDTPSNAPETPAAKEPENKPDDLLAKFGLSGQYSSVEDALAANRHKEAYIKQLEYERAQLMAAKQRPEPEPTRTLPTPPTQEEIQDALMRGDISVMQRAGYTDQRTVEQIVEKRVRDVESRFEQQRAVLETANAYNAIPELRDVAALIQSGGQPAPGINPVFDAMNQALLEQPVLLQKYKSGEIGEAALVPLLYRDYSVQAVVAARKAGGKPASPPARGLANTDSLKTSSGTGNADKFAIPSQEEWNKMSEKQIEDWFAQRGLRKSF